MTIICNQCQIEMRAFKTGQTVELMMADGPYQIRSGDAYACPKCSATVTAGLGTPIAEHYEPKYASVRGSYEGEGILRYWSTQNEKRQFEERCNAA